jgi:hypothetical protein
MAPSEIIITAQCGGIGNISRLLRDSGNAKFCCHEGHQMITSKLMDVFSVNKYKILFLALFFYMRTVGVNSFSVAIGQALRRPIC